MHVALLAVAALAATANAAGVSLTVDSKTGAYSVGFGSSTFSSGPYEFTTGNTTLSSADGSLKLQGAATSTGADDAGAFEATTLTWAEGAYVTQFRKYASMVVFEQSFPHGAQATSLNMADPMAARDDVSTAFPSFSESTTQPLGYLAFASDMTGDGYKHSSFVGDWAGLPHGVSGFGPTCFFSPNMTSSAVFSSYSQFMAASNGKRGTGMAYGLQASITAIPAEYSLSFVLKASSAGGVNQAMEEWGDVMLRVYGKSRVTTYDDYSLNYLGYSTDNGAYYYYQTEGHSPGKRGPPYTGPGDTYQQTLIDVKAYAVAEKIPYKYILLDSWWYYQGVGSGVTNWIGRPDVFPQGNSYLRNATGWPIMGHNRYWAVDNVYCTQNGGDYDFVVEKKGEDKLGRFNNFAWPTEQRFWDDLLYNSSQWGLFMYEQDWLDTEYDNVVHLNVNATAARTWLLQMGTAAERNHLTIQYCMSHCRHIMQSLELPAVTNARASGDYHAGGDQWRPLGTTGIFGWAVAIGPTKDNFWSTDEQTGSAYGDFATIREPYNRLQSAVSTLSKGPVATSDKIGRSDVALIMKSCTADGRLLQGDKPAMAIDAQHAKNAFTGGSDGKQHCRVTVRGGKVPSKCPVAKSNGGYTAYLPMNKKSGGGYVEHDDEFCECDGKGSGSCGHWAYESTTDDLAACQKKCDELGCSCFDHAGGSSSARTANVTISGPEGEVWAASTTLSGQKFGVVMGATLKEDYTLSLAKDMGLRAAKAYRHYEANATGAVSGTPTIALKACGKWDFQLHAVSPVLPNGWTLLGEPSKWVPVSATRFSDLQFESDAAAPATSSASVIATGSEGEAISVAWLAPGSMTPTVVQCVVPHGSRVSVQVSSKDPKGACVEV